MKNILPDWLYSLICKQFDEKSIYELRIRLNQPIIINYKGEFFPLISYDNINKNYIIADSLLISYIVSVSTKQSYYAFEDQIKKGYISTDNGIRIGICGTVVYDNNIVKTIKNIKSLNIRFAHKIENCSTNIVDQIYISGKIKNTLIISPPGAGKTTMLRDIVIKLSNEKNIPNILVADERYELAGFNQNFELGKNVDILSGCEKNFAFNEGIKVMNPTVIIADEISEEKDIESIKNAVRSGVSVIATAHANNILDLKNKNYFNSLLLDKYFERIIVLSKRNGVGTLEGIFNENLFAIYIPFSR